ncbi:MAG: alpha/beta fold hydrolase [Solirubrobacteraceae bacterium]
MSSPVTAADLDVEWVGAGPTVLLVHGSVVDARRTWRRQRELADHWTLCIPNRPGFASSPRLTRGDFELEAPLIAELLGGGAHLVGHSYGAVIALLAAAARPQAVRSLIVSEPGALRIAAGDPEVDTLIARGELLYGNSTTIPTSEFLRMFRAGLHSAHETPGELPEWLQQGAELLAQERPPWEAEIPLADLANAPFPKLVISGGHSAAFEAVCDMLAARIGAEREIITGRGHTIPSIGDAYNSRVERFLGRAERSSGTAGHYPSRERI